MRLFPILIAALLTLFALPAWAAPVLMISVDGLRPGDILEAEARGVTAPNLQRLAREGAFATGVRNALPSVTYPNHTTLITGVWPDRHGIVSNTTFDPLQKEMGAWWWYSADIRVPTLWDVAHQSGAVVASVGWPVSVDNPSIDWNVPEYWRVRTPGDLRLLHALATRGLPEAVAEEGKVTLADTFSDEPTADEAKARMAASIYRLKHPRLFTLHLTSLDHAQHLQGPGSPGARAVLARIDAAIGGLIAEARKAEPDLVVVIVSDHGFAPVDHDVNLGTAFVDAGLITLDKAGKPATWEAMPWISGGSAAIVLAHPEDAALRAKVAALLDKLAADPASGVGAVIPRSEVALRGGAPQADFFVEGKLGWEMGSKLKGPLVTPAGQKGQHGYFPDHPEMRATLIAAGPGVARHGSMGEVDMRDIAPTVAKLLGVAMPSAAGRALF